MRLQAGPGFQLPELDQVVEGVRAGPGDQRRLESVYFDTPDLRLARWGVSLHHQSGGEWTLTLPETALTFSGSPRNPPRDATDLVSAYVRGSALAAVARLSTLRRRVTLLGAAGRQLAEVVEDEVSVLQRRRVAARFREVEVDVASEGDGLREPLLWRLRLAGAGMAEALPTFLQALGPVAQEPPEVAPQPLPRDPSAAQVVTRALALSALAVLRHDPGVRLGSDPEDVHQARVGTRRLRSNLRTFRSLLVPEWADGLREELGWLAAELGAVRDGEVLLERLRAHTERLPAADRRLGLAIAGQLEGSIAESRATLLEAMRSQRYLDLLERLVASANRPELAAVAAEPADKVLPQLARKPWRRLRAAVQALPEDPPDPDLHACRIRAKRARYAAEAVAPASGRDAERFARAAAKLQTVLGDHQDSVVAQSWLRAHAGRGRRAFVAGEMAALELTLAESSRQAWPAAWSKLDRKRLRRWMKVTPPPLMPPPLLPSRERGFAGSAGRPNGQGVAEVLPPPGEPEVPRPSA